MLSGHASHQMGLDADIWFNPMPDRTLTTKERNNISARSVVTKRGKYSRRRWLEVNPKVWTEAHAKLLRRAASYRDVARIFVHPPIKKALCKWSEGQSNRKWLMKIRPYYGHHYHFHIRMRCPVGSQPCRNQPEPHHTDGTGCGEHLAYWFSDKPWKPKKPKKKPKTKPKPRKPLTLAGLPNACRTVLNAQ